jgi:hypothetical protein
MLPGLKKQNILFSELMKPPIEPTGHAEATNYLVLKKQQKMSN